MEKSPSGKNRNPKNPVQKKIEEMLIEAEAASAISQDEALRQVILRQKRLEHLVETEATQQASTEWIQAKKAEDQARVKTPPYGIAYLLGNRDLSTLYRRAEEAARQPRDERREAHERDTELEQVSDDARRLTLQFGLQIASRLREANTPPDVNVYTTESRQVRRVKGLGHLVTKGYYTRKETETNTTRQVDGWMIKIGETQAAISTAILCTDGRILTGYGKVDEERYQPRSRFEYEENNIYGRSNAGFLDETYGSDVTAPLIPIDNRLGAARTRLQREDAIQLALADLLVRKSVPIE